MNHQHYFNWNIDTGLTLVESYNSLFILFSYLVAIIAGFFAFSLISFIRANQSKHLMLSIFGGITLGFGIWAVHFTGMLALTLPIPIFYNVGITLISVIPAIIASIIFLHALSQDNISYVRAVVISLILATGIAIMHFTGMATMSMQAVMVHNPFLYICAIIISWILAVITVLIDSGKLKFTYLSNTGNVFLCAFFFGFAVATMHYLAMASTHFYPSELAIVSGVDNKVLSYVVIFITVVLMTSLTLVLAYKTKVNMLTDLATKHLKQVTATIDNMQDGFVLSDNEGIILLINQKFLDYFGHLDPLFIRAGDNINDMYENLMDTYFTDTENTDAANTENLLNAFNATSDAIVPLKIRTEDNKWWLLRKNRASSNTFIQVWTDITDQVSQEEKLIIANNTSLEALESLKKTQNELLETKKMAALGGVVTGVAHELNTPLGIGITALSAINSTVKEVQKKIIEQKVTKLYLDNSLESITDLESLATSSMEKAISLIQKFKDISVDQATGEINKFVLPQMLNSLLPLWGVMFDAKHITIKIDIEDDITVTSFEKTLIQILTCLVENSVKHAFAERTDNIIVLSATVKEERLILSYQDNGCGLSQYVTDKLFEPFVTTKRNEGGVGLGLHTVFNLVSQKLKGSIKLHQNEINKKSHFIINIPLNLE